MTTIFLSSTYDDLKEFRQIVFSDLRAAGYEVIAMEDYVASDVRPVDLCLADLSRSDLYVGIFAFRYGYIPPFSHGNSESLSVTELELRHAEKLGIPCLVFIADHDASISRYYDDLWNGEGECGARIRKLRDYLRTEKMAAFFRDPYHLSALVLRSIAKLLMHRPPPGRKTETAAPLPVITWDIATKGSPYPGLMHFTRKFAPVFFGRDAELREVLDRLHAPGNRFIIISGNSGSGKSSLVHAGVLPKLEMHGLPGNRSCRGLRMLPSQGSDPFCALREVLHPYVLQAGRDPQKTGAELLSGPDGFSEEINRVVTDGMDCAELVLFLDQMEELFTERGKEEAFLSYLYYAVHHGPLRVIATIRGDYLQCCHQHSDMVKIINSSGHYALGRVDAHKMREMIRKPALCAGLVVSASLVQRIIEDAEPDGNLPLLAFVLERLFLNREGVTLSEKMYDKLQGVKGALREHIEQVEAKLAKEQGRTVLDSLPVIFHSLVNVDLDGKPTRRRFLKNRLPHHLTPVIEVLISGRLVTVEGEKEASTIALVHEKLFEVWPALVGWLAKNLEDLLTLRLADLAARGWQKHSFDMSYLWHTERLMGLRDIIDRLEGIDVSPIVRDYAYPQAHFVDRLMDDSLTHKDRASIQLLLAELGDTRPGVGVTPGALPDIEWVPIPGGEVTIGKANVIVHVPPFDISRYPVTNAQFETFLNDKDGYRNTEWWHDLESRQCLPAAKIKASHPRVDVTWYEAVAFCRWLTRKYRELGLLDEDKSIRLPTEWEWQQAATGGNPDNIYPWGPQWDESRCNSAASGLGDTTVVGLYPHGGWPDGPMDMAGNVWEWCWNKHGCPGDESSVAVDRSGCERVARGGCWESAEKHLTSTYRAKGLPELGFDEWGFRLAQAR